MSQLYNGNIKTPKLQDFYTRDLKNLHILPKNSAEGRGSRRALRSSWSYVVSTFENTTKKLVVHGRMQLEHSSLIVNVGVKATW